MQEWWALWPYCYDEENVAVSFLEEFRCFNMHGCELVL